MAGQPRFVPCTPRGVLRLLREHGLPVAGERVAVVGRSLIVGRPLAHLLALKGPQGDATVTLCHSATRDMAAVVREARIVIAAVGAPGILDRRHVAEGAIVVDVGINRVADPTAKRGYRLCGDVASEALEGWAAAYTPVPGGVGPMTIAMLLENTWLAYTEAAR
jgi:methylenetetrahydrofolate dehydrogenase (NADP+)/methenyltetrahydrofolate cyclohydrolase